MSFVPHSYVVAFVTTITVALSGAWLVYDLRNLFRLRGADSSDPLVRDKRFGYVIGIITASVGLYGVVRYHTRPQAPPPGVHAAAPKPAPAPTPPPLIIEEATGKD